MNRRAYTICMGIVEEVGELYRSKLANAFYAEDVTEAAHACQTAQLAQEAGSPDQLIASAFLHDVGHLLLEDYLPAGSLLNKDHRHEHAGADYLDSHFVPAVVEPVRLHVTAKRYLCSIDDSYHDTLSKASKRSLVVQGGRMDEKEITEFERSPHWKAAVAIRKWDDLAKVPNQTTYPVAHWLEVLSRLTQL